MTELYGNGVSADLPDVTGANMALVLTWFWHDVARVRAARPALW